MELEAMLDPLDAPCPRCRTPLEGASTLDAPLCECPRCGGMFAPKEMLAEILSRAELGARLRESRAEGARALDEVRYLPCPLCHASMNRVNFGKVSGVIIDVCSQHGTWFDAGELTRVIAFVAAGGLVKTREREKAERHAIHAESVAVHAALSEQEAHDAGVSRWRDLLTHLLGW